jgi:putative peptidoglycan lipid II flippase
VPATASTFFNLGSLFFGLLIGKWMGPAIGVDELHGMAYGVVLGGALQLAWQLPSLYRAGFSFRPRLDWRHPGMQRILRLMGPAILGNAAVQINVTVNNNFASWLGDGPVSWLGYAFRFMQLPLGMFGVAIASATLPAISRSAAALDYDGFRQTLSRSLGLVFLLTVPSAVGLAVLSESIVGAIYQMRAFTSFDTEQTARALTCYVIGLAGYAATKVITPAFYALHDSRTPMFISMISIVVNFVTALTMIRVFGLGHAGLALSTSAVAITSSVTLFLIMRKRIGGIYGRNLWRTISRVTVASVVMGIAILASSHAVKIWLGTSKVARLTDLAISIPLGMFVVYFVSRALRVPELDMAVTAVAGPLRRRIPLPRRSAPPPA